MDEGTVQTTNKKVVKTIVVKSKLWVVGSNPSRITLENLISYSFDDKIKKELDKCVMLCNNCHKEAHMEEYRM